MVPNSSRVEKRGSFFIFLKNILKKFCLNAIISEFACIYR
jgi:hypothetical protein